MHNTIIETERLFLREFEKSDCNELYEIKNDKIVQEYSPVFLSWLHSPEKLADYLEEKRNSISLPSRLDCIYAICLKESGKIIGAIELYYYCRGNHISWHMNSEYACLGYASEASSAITDYVITVLEIDCICATMDIDNIASFRTAEKSGFEFVGKKDDYRGKNGELFYFLKHKENIGKIHYINITNPVINQNNEINIDIPIGFCIEVEELYI